ncbi:hypothetical protein KFL_006820050 [Klebsormidium nitens]|uniref:Uncharacterized protein n=1 Tax=Klebsormidium nitens TaxID=105231 RepID=A0A1Y1IQ68_KLENI|nr:hypothetical protein KFL_006820050 [Klebsormidium nitens]|eukprot:GAQ90767.1 hypothetical protein KFL_006820050 [Klebsormidium nitens]
MASVATIATPLAGALAVPTASAATRYAQPVVAGALPARRSIAGAALRKAGTSSKSSVHVCRKAIQMSAEQPKEEVPLVDRLAVPATLALVAMCAIPDVAFAAGPGVSPSLKNLLLSVGGGAAVLAAIAIGIAGVSTFDPVKRGGRR